MDSAHSAMYKQLSLISLLLLKGQKFNPNLYIYYKLISKRHMTLWIVTVYKLLWNILAFPTAIYTNLFNMLLIMVKLPSLEAAYLAMYLIPYVVSGKAVLLHQLFSHYLFRLLKGVYVVYSHMPVSA